MVSRKISAFKVAEILDVFFLFHVDVTVPWMENPCLIPVDVLGELSEVGRLML